MKNDEHVSVLQNGNFCAGVVVASKGYRLIVGRIELKTALLFTFPIAIIALFVTYILPVHS